jgi:hypothetical protein
MNPKRGVNMTMSLGENEDHDEEDTEVVAVVAEEATMIRTT